ncbi:MAG: hypothetical protein IT305_32050 [Chloroflexi bacterium]|nr:hypothetical protein [Chloroflexota bacterium]
MSATLAPVDATHAPPSRRASRVWRLDLRAHAIEAVPFLVIALCSLVLFHDGLFGNVVFYEKDTELFYQPLGRWYAEQVRAGDSALWIPLIFGGYPLFADGELGMLYPLNLLLVPLLTPTTVLTVMRAIHLFLGGAFAILYLRTLGLTRTAALVGGLVFAFGSFLVAQLQHENVVRSAVWLPLILLCAERSFRVSGWRRQRWLVGGGLVLACAALGVHIQPVFMTLVCLGLYTTYRVLVGPVTGPRWERALQLVWAPGLICAIGLGAAAIQWLPLFELGRMSYRGPGLNYDLATTWPLRWQNLATVVLPYLFRLPDGRFITLWQQWETYLYVGIMPLGLAVLGVLLARRRIVPFFVMLAAFGLVVGLAEQSPLNLHRLLWMLPGFSSLRAPGRYAYLIVFAAAVLAACGADVLTRARRRSWPLTLGALVVTGWSAGTIYTIVALHQRLAADPVRWKKLIDDYYLSTRHEHEWLTGPMVYQQLVDGLDLSSPKTLWSVALLVVCAGVLFGWALWPRLSGAWATVTVAVIAIDLLAFAYDYHPMAALDDLMRPAPVTQFLATLGPDARTFADGSLQFLEPNRLLHADVPTISGYSSLETQRHFEYWSNVDGQEDTLLDLWSTRYVVMADPPRDIAIVDGTAYRPFNALFNGAAFNRTGRATFDVEPVHTVEVRVLATLIDGVQIEQDTPVAELVLTGTDGTQRTVRLRAGVDVAENAYERPDVRPHLRHARPPVAGTIKDIAPNGQPTDTNIYRARLPVDPLDVVSVEVHQVYPLGQTRVFGIGLVNEVGQVRSIFGSDRAKFRPVWRQDGIVVLENRAAYPRAYIVPEGIARRSRSEESALPRMAMRPFDAARQVILEEGPFDGLPLVRPRLGQELSSTTRPAAATVEDISSEHVRIVTPDGPGGFLVLTDQYHRGWRAEIDGQPTPVYIANFLFRGVYLPPGPHTVDFVFDPLSLRLGRAITLTTLAFATLVGLILPWWQGRRSHRTASRSAVRGG